MNDPLEQQLYSAVMDLKNRLDSIEFNGRTDYQPPPSSFKPDMPQTKRLDIKSIFTGQGMPPMEEEQPTPNQGGYFGSALNLIDADTVGPQETPVIVPQSPPSCPTSGTVTVVLSGIVSCGCAVQEVYTISLNGTYTLTWDGISEFAIASVGSWSVQDYSDDGCATPTGDPTTGAWNIGASCSDGNWTVDVTPDKTGDDAFFTSTPEPMGSPISNSVICSGTTGPRIGGGTATVS